MQENDDRHRDDFPDAIDAGEINLSGRALDMLLWGNPADYNPIEDLRKVRRQFEAIDTFRRLALEIAEWRGESLQLKESHIPRKLTAQGESVNLWLLRVRIVSIVVPVHSITPRLRLSNKEGYAWEAPIWGTSEDMQSWPIYCLFVTLALLVRKSIEACGVYDT